MMLRAHRYSSRVNHLGMDGWMDEWMIIPGNKETNKQTWEGGREGGRREGGMRGTEEEGVTYAIITTKYYSL